MKNKVDKTPQHGFMRTRQRSATLKTRSFDQRLDQTRREQELIVKRAFQLLHAVLRVPQFPQNARLVLSGEKRRLEARLVPERRRRKKTADIQGDRAAETEMREQKRSSALP